MTALVDSVCYNDLPSLGEANISRQAPSIDDIINGPIREVFLKHAANLTLCLYLQHRHHTVGTDEAVVKVEGTAHLMRSQAVKDIVSFGNKVVPTTWMASSGKVLPMEFAVVPAETATPAPTPAFVLDFLSALALNGCDGLFGIDTIAKGAWTEMSIGDASVVVPSNDSDGYDQDKFVPVAFTFDQENPNIMPDGNDFDGKQLLTLVHSGNSPFHGLWDVNLLIREIEENLDAHVIDTPVISKGSNNYGLHLKLSNRPDIVARMSRDDVNMPNFDGAPIHKQVPEVKFEVAVYELLRLEPNILASRLLYHRIPVQQVGPRLDLPQDIAGRHLFLFERAEGEKNIWRGLSPEQKACLLAQSARIRASLFNFNLPLDFATVWLRERLFEQKPKLLPIPVAPTREFCVALFMSKIEATIRNIGDMIGWESDNVTVGPLAAAAKQSLLCLC